jgi:hypothetical protein
MSIQALLEVVAAPAEPFEAFAGPWDTLEAELGTPLPQDYKDFARIFGSGYFMEYLGVSIPRSQNPYTRFETEIGVICKTFAEFEDAELRHPMWPLAGGLIPFGGTDNGDYLFWLSEGVPENWRVVVWDRGMQEFEVLDLGLTDFLAGLATNDLAPKGFPESLLPCDELFQPNSAWRAAD